MRYSAHEVNTHSVIVLAGGDGARGRINGPNAITFLCMVNTAAIGGGDPRKKITIKLK